MPSPSASDIPTIDLPGLPVPMTRIGLGTWQFGSREWGYGQDYATREARAIVHRAIELGVTFFDTAEMYALGQSERILGAAIVGQRERVLLASKIFPILPLAPLVVRRARASGRRLGVARIDLYQVHWPNPLVPIASTMRGMRELQDAGVIGEVGVSNFGLAGWQAAEEALGRRVLSNQVQYSLLAREPEHDLIPWAEAHGRVVIAYSPLAQGALAGKYDATHRPRGSRTLMNPVFRPQNMRRLQPLIDTLREVAAAHGVTPAQVALAWTIRSPAVVVIPGASSVAQLESNVAAAHLALRPDEITALTAAATAFEPAPLIAAPARAAGLGLVASLGWLMWRRLRSRR